MIIGTSRHKGLSNHRVGGWALTYSGGFRILQKGGMGYDFGKGGVECEECALQVRALLFHLLSHTIRQSTVYYYLY